MLGTYHLVNQENCREFLLACQTKIGGFGKTPGTYPGTSCLFIFDERKNNRRLKR